MGLKHIIGRFFELFSTHSYRHYATEGPYDDGTIGVITAAVSVGKTKSARSSGWTNTANRGNRGPMTDAGD